MIDILSKYVGQLERYFVISFIIVSRISRAYLLLALRGISLVVQLQKPNEY